MPYINKSIRQAVMKNGPTNAGELNFLLSEIVFEYWTRNGQNYQAFNDVMGALEGCKLELYRRKIAPYEDTKIEQNGDCYGQDFHTAQPLRSRAKEPPVSATQSAVAGGIVPVP